MLKMISAPALRLASLLFAALLLGQIGLTTLGCSDFGFSKGVICDEDAGETYDSETNECIPAEGYTYSCNDSPSNHSATTFICVSADPLFFTSDNCVGSTGTTNSSIASALLERSGLSSATTVAIYLGGSEVFTEAVSLYTTTMSNTMIIGCDTGSTIAAPTTSATATTHAVSLDGDVSNVGFYNLTMQGIGSAASSTDAEVNLTAATLWVNAATNVSAEGVAINESYAQAIKVETGAHADFTDVAFGTLYPAASSIYATDIFIGIWNEGTVTASDLAFATSPDVGIFSYGGSFNLSSTSFSGNSVAAVVSAGWAETSLSDVTVSSGSHLGVYSKDSSFFSVSNSSIETSNVYPVVVCQDNSEDTTDYEAYFESNPTLGAMRLGSVSVDGSGNVFSGSIYVDNADLNGQFASEATTASDVDCSLSLY